MSRRREDWSQQAGVTTDDLLTQMYGTRLRRTSRLAVTPDTLSVDEAESRLWRGITVALVLEIAVVLVLAAGAAAWRCL